MKIINIILDLFAFCIWFFSLTSIALILELTLA